MARDHAQIRLSIWDDEDFRSLSANAQHLYWWLLLHPKLSYCGVVDWRPARLGAMAGDWDRATVEAVAGELVDRLYLLIDEDTEEVLVRSFVRNDGLMKQPKMATAMATAYSSVGSSALRGVVVWELQRLHREQPDLKGWGSERARALLDRAAVDPSTYPCGNPSRNPSAYPSGNPSANPSANPTGNPSANPFPETSANPSGNPPAKGSASPYSLLLTPSSPSEPKGSGRASRPPTDDMDQAETAQTVVGWWIDQHPQRPPGQVIGQVSKLVKQLLNESFDPDIIKRALTDMGRKGQHPSTLPSFVHALTSGGVPVGVPDAEWQAYEAKLARVREHNRREQWNPMAEPVPPSRPRPTAVSR